MKTRESEVEEMEGAWYDGLYERHEHLWLAANTMLLLMSKSGLPMNKARAATFDIEDPETVAVYVMDLQEAGITADDIMADGHACRRGLKFFPSSGELTELLVALKELRKPSTVVSDPVWVAYRGGIALTSKEDAFRRKEAFWTDEFRALEDLGLYQRKALPEGVDGKTALATIVRELEQQMRMPRAENDPKRVDRSSPAFKQAEREIEELAQKRRKVS